MHPRHHNALNIRYFTHSDTHGPSSRYRVHQYQKVLNAHGVHLHTYAAFGSTYIAAEARGGHVRTALRALSFLRAAGRRTLQLNPYSNADCHGTMIERELFPRLPAAIELPLVRSFGRYGVEFDDAIYLSPGRGSKIPQLLSQAAIAIVGNQTLADFAMQYCQQIEVVPTSIDLGQYPVKQNHDAKERLRIGWVGLPSNYVHLQHISSVLSALQQTHDIELVLVSARPPHPQELQSSPYTHPLKFLFEPWHETKEAELIRSFDIGIMPLDDTPFARGKCGLKLLQYMACGVPVVASAVGVNRRIVKDNCGILARTPSDWHEGLTCLLLDRNLRYDLGQNARCRVEEHYNHKTWGKILAEIYKTAFV